MEPDSATPANCSCGMQSGVEANAAALPEVTADAVTKHELVIYDPIGGWSGVDSWTVNAWLRHPDRAGMTECHVRINSPGGSVAHGVAIYNMLSAHAARVIVHVDGFALSAASVIAMAGDEIRMAKNALMMVHEASACVCGQADDHASTADLLRKINVGLIACYVARTGMDEKEVKKLVEAETWMTADEALEKGFCSFVVPAKAKEAEKEEGQAAAAQWKPESAQLLASYKNLPTELLAMLERGLRFGGAQEVPQACALPGRESQRAAQPAVDIIEEPGQVAAVAPVRRVNGRLQRSHMAAMASPPSFGGLKGTKWI
jgi:ATP-dependent Clp protease, protease subunit